MEFISTQDITNIQTKFFLNEDNLVGCRYITGKLYSLNILISDEDTFNEVIGKAQNLTNLDNDTFLQFSEIAKRVKDSVEETDEA